MTKKKISSKPLRARRPMPMKGKTVDPGNCTLCGSDETEGAASTAYRIRYAACRSKLTAALAGLRVHAVRQDEDPWNWGNAGDLARVEELANLVLEALGGPHAE